MYIYVDIFIFVNNDNANVSKMAKTAQRTIGQMTENHNLYL